MPWHVFSQIGGADDFAPDIALGEPRLPIAIDKPGCPYQVAGNLMQKVLDAGLSPAPIAVDLLNVALAVFTADLRVWRGYETDQWTRDIVLYLPVSQVDLWNGARNTLIELASFLTGDTWDVQFRPLAMPTAIQVVEPLAERPQTVSLFSGGLDSYIRIKILKMEHSHDGRRYKRRHAARRRK